MPRTRVRLKGKGIHRAVMRKSVSASNRSHVARNRRIM